MKDSSSIARFLLKGLLMLVILAWINKFLITEFMQAYSVAYSYLLFGLTTLFLAIASTDIRRRFSNVRRISWLMLIVLLIILAGFNLGSNEFYGMTIDEPAIIEISHNLAAGEKNVFCEPMMDYLDCGFSFLPFGWPFINSLVYKLFGFSAEITVLSILLAKLLTILTAFLLIRYVSGKDWMGLLGSFILASSSLFSHWSLTLNSIIPTTALLSATSLFLFMFLREKKLWQGLGTLIFWVCTAAIRTEMLVLALPIGLVFLRNRMMLKDRKNLYPLLICLVLLSTIVMFTPHFIETQKGFLGEEEQIFGLEVLYSNIQVEFVHWLQGDYFPLFFLLLGLAGAFGHYRREPAEFWTGVMILLSIFFVYLFWHYSDQRRFFITLMPFISLYIVMGFGWFTSRFKNSNVRKGLLAAIIFLVISYGATELSDSYDRYKHTPRDLYASMEIEKVIPAGCTLIMEEPVMLPFMNKDSKLSYASLTGYGFKSLDCTYLLYDYYCIERSSCKNFKEDSDTERMYIFNDYKIYRVKG